MADAASMRREYTRAGLREEVAGDDPLALFARWFDEAAVAAIREPNAMILSTLTGAGPAARTVLLKGFDGGGFVFYTGLASAKSRELEADPRCALTFLWVELERQVRVEGVASRAPEAEADAYFASRPRASQLGAWASPQSEVIAGREVLEDNLRAAEARFAGAPVPRPPHWGGWRVRPRVMEFWQGRPGRLHDRLRYRREGDTWRRERLGP